MKKVGKMITVVGVTLFSAIILTGMNSDLVRAETISQSKIDNTQKQDLQIVDDVQTQVPDKPAEDTKRIIAYYNDISYEAGRPVDFDDFGKYQDVGGYVDVSNDTKTMNINDLIDKYPIPKGYAITNAKGEPINKENIPISFIKELNYYHDLDMEDKEIFKIDILPIQKFSESIVINDVKIPCIIDKRFDLDESSLPYLDPSEKVNLKDYELDKSSVIGLDIKMSGLGEQRYPIDSEGWLAEYIPDYSLAETNQGRLDKVTEWISKTMKEDSVIIEGSNFAYDLVYKPKEPSADENIKVEFKTADGKDAIEPILEKAPEMTKDASDYGSEVPDNYQLSNSTPTYRMDGTTLVLSFEVEAKETEEPQKPSGGSGSISIPTNPSTDISENIAVHPNLSQANLYDNNGNILDTKLTSKATRHADQKKTINGITYYRIAANAWVKASDVYIYYDQPTHVRTYLDSYKRLVNSQEKKIKNRALHAGTDWYSDRYAYFNGDKYYRVSTNEWIKAEDVFEYDPIDEVITTTGNQVFNETGTNIGEFVAGITLKTDKTAIINGTKMYRVATNEWIK